MTLEHGGPRKDNDIDDNIKAVLLLWLLKTTTSVSTCESFRRSSLTHQLPAVSTVDSQAFYTNAGPFTPTPTLSLQCRLCFTTLSSPTPVLLHHCRLLKNPFQFHANTDPSTAAPAVSRQRRLFYNQPWKFGHFSRLNIANGDYKFQVSRHFHSMNITMIIIISSSGHHFGD